MLAMHNAHSPSAQLENKEKITLDNKIKFDLSEETNYCSRVETAALWIRVHNVIGYETPAQADIMP